jgi:hypothetical protein
MKSEEGKILRYHLHFGNAGAASSKFRVAKKSYFIIIICVHLRSREPASLA